MNIATSDIPLKTRFFELHFTLLFKVIQVTDFGTNRKTKCNFLLAINSNLPSILHCFQVMADYWSIFH